MRGRAETRRKGNYRSIRAKQNDRGNGVAPTLHRSRARCDSALKLDNGGPSNALERWKRVMRAIARCARHLPGPPLHGRLCNVSPVAAYLLRARTKVFAADQARVPIALSSAKVLIVARRKRENRWYSRETPGKSRLLSWRARKYLFFFFFFLTRSILSPRAGSRLRERGKGG